MRNRHSALLALAVMGAFAGVAQTQTARHDVAIATPQVQLRPRSERRLTGVGRSRSLYATFRASGRTVAMDKRDARKRRNRLRSKR